MYSCGVGHVSMAFPFLKLVPFSKSNKVTSNVVSAQAKPNQCEIGKVSCMHGCSCIGSTPKGFQFLRLTDGSFIVFVCWGFVPLLSFFVGVLFLLWFLYCLQSLEIAIDSIFNNEHCLLENVKVSKFSVAKAFRIWIDCFGMLLISIRRKGGIIFWK